MNEERVSSQTEDIHEFQKTIHKLAKKEGLTVHFNVDVEGFQVESYIPELSLVVDILKKSNFYPRTRMLANVNQVKKTIIKKSCLVYGDEHDLLNINQTSLKDLIRMDKLKALLLK